MTALVAGVMTILMGVVANYPFALAAGLGLNAFVAFSLVAANGLSFPQAMGVIVVEGLLITVLVLTGVREAILNAIPMDLKRAIGIGIGAFIALIGLVNAGVVTNTGATPPARRRAHDVADRGVRRRACPERRAGRTPGQGGLADRDLVSTVLAIIVNEAKDLSIWERIAAIPDGVVDTPDFGLVGAFSFDFFSVLGTATALAVVLSVMLSDFFDTMGTVIGLGGEMKMLTRTGGSPASSGSCWSTRSPLPPVAPHRHRRTRRTSRARRGSPKVVAPVWSLSWSGCCSCWRCSSRRSPG